MRASTDSGRAADDTAQPRYAWRVLSVTSLGVLLAGTNTSTLDVALPVVARHFSANANAGHRPSAVQARPVAATSPGNAD